MRRKKEELASPPTPRTACSSHQRRILAYAEGTSGQDRPQGRSRPDDGSLRRRTPRAACPHLTVGGGGGSVPACVLMLPLAQRLPAPCSLPLCTGARAPRLLHAPCASCSTLPQDFMSARAPCQEGTSICWQERAGAAGAGGGRQEKGSGHLRPAGMARVPPPPGPPNPGSMHRPRIPRRTCSACGSGPRATLRSYALRRRPSPRCRRRHARKSRVWGSRLAGTLAHGERGERGRPSAPIA